MESTNTNALINRKIKKRSMIAEVWERLRKNKGAVFGMCLALLMVLIAITSGFLFDYETDVIGQNIKGACNSLPGNILSGRMNWDVMFLHA